MNDSTTNQVLRVRLHIPFCFTVLLTAACSPSSTLDIEMPKYSADACCDTRLDAQVEVSSSPDAPVFLDMRMAELPMHQDLDLGLRENGLLDGSIDQGMEDLCREKQCEPGQVCRGSTGDCVERNFGQPGGPCGDDDDCEQGMCRRFGESPPICWQPCQTDMDCPEMFCADSSYGLGCLPRCTDRKLCSQGLVCRPRDQGALDSVCLPDCRIFGCVGQLGCDVDTGWCLPSNIPCPFDCQIGELCSDGRCIRLSGTCETDYHCSPRRLCHDGHCAMNAGFACEVSDDCDLDHLCISEHLSEAVCQKRCEQASQCPPSHFCDGRTSTCRLAVCGQIDDASPLYSPCAPDAVGVFGTCVPFSGDAPIGYEADGYCVESGHAMVNTPCDAQERGRSNEARADQCQIGSLCFNDPDGLSPLPDQGGRGLCRAICVGGSSECGDLACVRVGGVDDPMTAENEAYPLSLCLPVDCTIHRECGVNRVCQPYGFWSSEGVCRLDGQAGIGDECQSDGDCRGLAMCVARPNGSQCVRLCTIDGAICPIGQRCYVDHGWAYGVCI